MFHSDLMSLSMLRSPFEFFGFSDGLLAVLLVWIILFDIERGFEQKKSNGTKKSSGLFWTGIGKKLLKSYKVIIAKIECLVVGVFNAKQCSAVLVNGIQIRCNWEGWHKCLGFAPYPDKKKRAVLIKRNSNALTPFLQNMPFLKCCLAGR